ncbi:hypothetical protein CHUAL_010510 [Chamberlinius hualienensis]
MYGITTQVILAVTSLSHDGVTFEPEVPNHNYDVNKAIYYPSTTQDGYIGETGSGIYGKGKHHPSTKTYPYSQPINLYLIRSRNKKQIFPYVIVGSGQHSQLYVIDENKKSSRILTTPSTTNKKSMKKSQRQIVTVPTYPQYSYSGYNPMDTHDNNRFGINIHVGLTKKGLKNGFKKGNGFNIPLNFQYYHGSNRPY